MGKVLNWQIGILSRAVSFENSGHGDQGNVYYFRPNATGEELIIGRSISAN